MASKFSIESVISMVDKVSGPMGRASKSVTGFSKKMRNQFTRADITAQSLNKRMNKVGGRATQVGLAGLGAGAAIVGKQFVEFDDAIFGATARFKAAEKPGTDMTKVMKNLRTASRETGKTTQFSATLMAKGLDKFALAGFTSQEAIKALATQVDLATVTGEDFMRVADISSDLLGAFGGAALKGAAKIAKLKEMNALLAVGTLSANVTMEDLFETLKQAAPIGTQLGLSMKDVIATTSVLGSAGIKGSMAATAMKNIFLRLVKPTKDVKESMAALGLVQRDFVQTSGKNKGSLKSTADIFALIGKRTKGMEKVKVSRLFAGLAGLRGTAGAAVIAKNIDEINKQMIRMGDKPQKVMAATAAFMRKSLGNRVKALGSALTELGFKIFSAFAGNGKKGIDQATNAINNFNVQPIIDTLKIALAIFSAVFTVIGPFLPAILAIAAGVKIWAIAQTALNVIMMANPIGIVIGAIFLMVSAIKFLRTSTNTAFLPMQLQLQEYIFGFNMLKLRIMQVGNALGLVSNQAVGSAMADAQVSFIQGKILAERLKQSQAQKQPLAQQGQSIGVNNQSINGRVDIGITGPKDTTVESTGIADPFRVKQLDQGFQG